MQDDKQLTCNLSMGLQTYIPGCSLQTTLTSPHVHTSAWDMVLTFKVTAGHDTWFRCSVGEVAGEQTRLYCKSKNKHATGPCCLPLRKQAEQIVGTAESHNKAAGSKADGSTFMQKPNAVSAVSLPANVMACCHLERLAIRGYQKLHLLLQILHSMCS